MPLLNEHAVRYLIFGTTGGESAVFYVQTLRTTKKQKAPETIDFRGFHLYGGEIGTL